MEIKAAVEAVLRGRRREKSETSQSSKDNSSDNVIWGVNDIARSIRESGKFQAQRNSWRKNFHF
ncbi:hypothetical protein HY798_00665 [Candidatus Falkowbacteria bacterium]|nr:hypothetical protein [Candidatus Falkowbacteria bacterium]